MPAEDRVLPAPVAARIRMRLLFYQLLTPLPRVKALSGVLQHAVEGRFEARDARVDVLQLVETEQADAEG